MPPQKDEIWTNYIEAKNAAGITVKVTCKHCGQTYAAPNATRMRKHILESCKKCPPIVREKFSSSKAPKTSTGQQSDKRVREGGSSGSSTDIIDPDEPSAPQNNSTSTGLPAGTSNAQPSSAKKRQKLMFENYFDRVTKEEKEKVDEHFARAVYAKGLPLCTFEGPHMRNAFEALRPAYQPPSRKLLSDRLLKAEYNRAMSQNHDIIDKALCLTLVTDGWTNRRGEGIINFVVGTPEPVFLKSTEPGSERENAPFIYKELSQIMQKVGAHRVMLITTDNAKVMKAACKMVQECYPHVYFIGCGSHSFNLLFKDILKTNFFKTLLSQCLTIIQIRKKRQLYAYFKEKQQQLYGEKKANLILPSPTRFCGSYFVFSSVKKNKQALQETVLAEKEELIVPDDIRSIVVDNAFWSKLSYAVDYLQSLAQGTHLIESDHAKLSETVAISMNVKHNLSIFSDQCPIPSSQRDEICEAVDHRIKNFCVTKLHLAAYLVDPGHRCDR